MTLPVAALLAGIASAAACPFCQSPGASFSERIAQADAVALGQWIDARKGGVDTPGRTTFELVHVVKSPGNVLEKGERVELPTYRTGRPGDLFLLLGRRAERIDWEAPQEMTETGFQYILRAPSVEAPAQRLEYFLKFLESPDPLIANDAYAEFAQAPYEHVAALQGRIPRDKVRQWLTDPETPAVRLGFYGLLLGLCGQAEDASLLERRILEPADEFRLGLDGIMGGYLLLRGEEGLERIERAVIANREAPAGDVYSAMSALRFLWTYGNGRIPRERVKESMRRLVDREDVAELAIADLSRWRDWSVQDRLMALYDAEFESPTARRAVRMAIVRYMLASTQDVPEDGSELLPEHVLTGRKYVELLREKDPALVRNAERFVF